MGIKDRRTKILLSLLLLSDVNLTPVSFDHNIQEIFELTLNQKTRGTISGLIAEGKIEKIQKINDKPADTGPSSFTQSNPDENERSKLSEIPTGLQGFSTDSRQGQTADSANVYKLTDQGFYQLCLKFPFFRYLRYTWDSKWRVLSYEIPESKRELRDRLRREIAGWGLGPWHRSFWITPHPIIENLRDLVFQREEDQYIQAFESAHVVGNKDILIEKVWQKSTLDKKYRNLFKVWHEILSKDGQKLEKFKQVINEYIDILKIDPGLPSELVGMNWIGFEAFNIYKEIRSILLS